MNNKKDLITSVIYNNLPESSTSKSLSLAKCQSVWWATRRTTDCLRLSDEGEQAFFNAEIEFYEFPLTKMDKQTYPQFIRKVSKVLDCPYYIGFKNKQYKSAYIKVYDSKVAMMITLYGNFKDYLESKNV